MTDKKFRPADITPGMVALLWDMPSFTLLADVFKELVRRRDIESIQVVLNSDTLQEHPWADLPFHLLPLKDSEDPRARELYATWSAKMSGQDPEKMAHRLLYLAGLNDRNDAKRSEIAEEIIHLMNIGADVESPIGPAKRTPLGEAINSTNVHTANLIIGEFAKRNPDRLPLAAKGKDALSFLVANQIGSFNTAAILAKLAEVYDFSQERLKVGASKALSKLIGTPKLSDSSDCVTNLSALVLHDMINGEALGDLWRMVGIDRFVRTAPFLLTIAKKSKSSDEDKALATFAKFVQNGIDIDAPLPDGSRPIDYVLGAGTDKFFAAVLEAGVDLKRLQEQIRIAPDEFKSVPPERIAMINALVARRQVMDVVNAGHRPQVA